tara:strand:+ start:816 stop:1895 length:1080 start_codon:yes stop_codon:yes gene_type:complete
LEIDQVKIIDKTPYDMKKFKQIASDFYPYAKKRLGFSPDPVLHLVSDVDNANEPFGKTAYYEPNNMKIVIYVDGRHPKDMLRSLSHELVHHHQHCNGEFDNIGYMGKGYAQKSPYMRKKEAVAYLFGNGFLVRDYEDSLKESLIKERNKMSKHLIEEFEKTLISEDNHKTDKYDDEMKKKGFSDDQAENLPDALQRNMLTDELAEASTVENLDDYDRLREKYAEAEAGDTPIGELHKMFDQVIEATEKLIYPKVEEIIGRFNGDDVFRGERQKMEFAGKRFELSIGDWYREKEYYLQILDKDSYDYILEVNVGKMSELLHEAKKAVDNAPAPFSLDSMEESYKLRGNKIFESLVKNWIK